MTSYAGQQIFGGMGYRFAMFTVSQKLIDAIGKDRLARILRQRDEVPENALLREYPLKETGATEPNQFAVLPCPPEQVTHWRWEFVWVDGEQG